MVVIGKKIPAPCPTAAAYHTIQSSPDDLMSDVTVTFLSGHTQLQWRPAGGRCGPHTRGQLSVPVLRPGASD